ARGETESARRLKAEEVGVAVRYEGRASPPEPSRAAPPRTRPRYRAGVTGTETSGHEAAPRVLWTPPPDVLATARIGRYLGWLATNGGPRFRTYDDLRRWSVEQPGAFWRSIWDHFEVLAHDEPTADLADARMPGARWFPGSTLNYAEHALRLPGRAEGDVVVIGRSQTRGPVDLTSADLRDQVARCRQGLERLGVRPGDRIAAYLP